MSTQDRKNMILDKHTLKLLPIMLKLKMKEPEMSKKILKRDPESEKLFNLGTEEGVYMLNEDEVLEKVD